MKSLICKTLLVLAIPLLSETSCYDKKSSEEVCDDPFGIDCINYSMHDGEPAWAPDGSVIAYIHGDTVMETTGLYLINPDGSNKRIIFAGISAHSPSWSPDGRWIAFANYGQIYKIKANGDSLTQLTTEGSNYFPDWSPDGIWIAYDTGLNDPKGANAIWKMKYDGTSKTDISQHGTGEWRQPDWSPDGDKIVHLRYVTSGGEIVIMDKNGQNPVRLTFDENVDRYPHFSPDGTKITFVSLKNNSLQQVCVMNSDGSHRKQLTSSQGDRASWSADGRKIIYTNTDPDNGYLWIMNSDGSNKRQLTFQE